MAHHTQWLRAHKSSPCRPCSIDADHSVSFQLEPQSRAATLRIQQTRSLNVVSRVVQSSRRVMRTVCCRKALNHAIHVRNMALEARPQHPHRQNPAKSLNGVSKHFSNRFSQRCQRPYATAQLERIHICIRDSRCLHHGRCASKGFRAGVRAAAIAAQALVVTGGTAVAIQRLARPDVRHPTACRHICYSLCISLPLIEMLFRGVPQTNNCAIRVFSANLRAYHMLYLVHGRGLSYSPMLTVPLDHYDDIHTPVG